MIQLPERERFTTEADALVLQNAAEESYQKTANKLKIGDQEITKVTVMNIVHGLLADHYFEPLTPSLRSIID